MRFKPPMRRLALVLCLLAPVLVAPGCATVAGTAVSPVTGGVDLVRENLQPHQWYFVPPFFLAGAVTGPFVAFYNGVNYDASIFRGWRSYWIDFGGIFQPFIFIRKEVD